MHSLESSKLVDESYFSIFNCFILFPNKVSEKRFHMSLISAVALLLRPELPHRITFVLDVVSL